MIEHMQNASVHQIYDLYVKGASMGDIRIKLSFEGKYRLTLEEINEIIDDINLLYHT